MGLANPVGETEAAEEHPSAFLLFEDEVPTPYHGRSLALNIENVQSQLRVGLARIAGSDVHVQQQCMYAPCSTLPLFPSDPRACVCANSVHQPGLRRVMLPLNSSAAEMSKVPSGVTESLGSWTSGEDDQGQQQRQRQTPRHRGGSAQDLLQGREQDSAANPSLQLCGEGVARNIPPSDEEERIPGDAGASSFPEKSTAVSRVELGLVGLPDGMEKCHAGIVAALGNDRKYPDNQEAGDVAYDHKEAICLDLSRAAGVAAVPLRGAGTPTASHSDLRKERGRETVTQTGGNRMDTTSNNDNVGTVPTTRDNIMDMSVRGQEDITRFSAAVAATAADNTTLAPSDAGLLPRRKAPITPAVRYLMEAMCIDLVACGECFVPHFRARHTLVRFCGFIPPEVREGLDKETRRFMEGEDVCGAVGGNVTGGEAYGRGIGLPGIAWATARATLVEVSTLTSDASFDCGGVRCAPTVREQRIASFSRRS